MLRHSRGWKVWPQVPESSLFLVQTSLRPDRAETSLLSAAPVVNDDNPRPETDLIASPRLHLLTPSSCGLGSSTGAKGACKHGAGRSTSVVWSDSSHLCLEILLPLYSPGLLQGEAIFRSQSFHKSLWNTSCIFRILENDVAAIFKPRSGVVLTSDSSTAWVRTMCGEGRSAVCSPFLPLTPLFPNHVTSVLASTWPSACVFPLHKKLTTFLAAPLMLF